MLVAHAQALFDAQAVDLARVTDHHELRGLLSDEHFSVDATQVATWASMKSFRAKGGSGDAPGLGRNGEPDFNGEKRSNSTYASTTDPEAQLLSQGTGQADPAIGPLSERPRKR